MEQPNEFMQALKSNFKHFIDIIAENQDAILAVPPTGFFSAQGIAVDEMMITEHILQLSFDGKEITSLNGRTFKLVSDKSLRGVDDPAFQTMIISRDITYADSQRTFKRWLINNCLDPRHYKPEQAADSRQAHRDDDFSTKDPYQ